MKWKQQINYGENMDKQNGIKIDIMPKWMNITMLICRWIIATTPFVIASVMMFFKPETLFDNWMLTCLYLLTLNNLIWFVEKDND
jgi:hypothetical protein